MNSSPVCGVLFDWRGTLFHNEEDVDWIRASAASIGRDLSVAQAMELIALVGMTSQHPDVIAARRRADCSVDLNRAATLLELRLAGCDDDLALAMWQRDGSPGVSLPYTDVPEVMAELKTCGMRTGVVSDIHHDLRPIFERCGLGHLVDAPIRCRSNTVCRNRIRACSRLRWPTWAFRLPKR
jgi:FMN phosphatase YigB (HAD superfamily)